MKNLNEAIKHLEAKVKKGEATEQERAYLKMLKVHRAVAE